MMWLLEDFGFRLCLRSQLLSRSTFVRRAPFIPARMRLRQPIKVAVKVCDQGRRLKAGIQGDRFGVAYTLTLDH
jgi:hypothetical protein